MPHVICPSCHVQYNATAPRCPNCGVRRPRFWTPLIERRWPVALAAGLILEALAVRLGPASLHPASLHSVEQAPLVEASWYLAGALLFAVLVSLAMAVVGGVGRTLRRRMQRAARRKLARKRM